MNVFPLFPVFPLFHLSNFWDKAIVGILSGTVDSNLSVNSFKNAGQIKSKGASTKKTFVTVGV